MECFQYQRLRNKVQALISITVLFIGCMTQRIKLVNKLIIFCNFVNYTIIIYLKFYKINIFVYIQQFLLIKCALIKQ